MCINNGCVHKQSQKKFSGGSEILFFLGSYERAHRVVHGKLSHFGENTWGVDFKHHNNLILVHYIT